MSRGKLIYTGRKHASYIAAVALMLVMTGAMVTCAQESQDKSEPIRWTLKAEPQAVPLNAGGRFNALLTATIGEGWHLYSPEQPPGGALPTRISLPAGQPFKLDGDIDFPGPQSAFDPVFSMETQIFEGEVTFTIPIVMASDAMAGRQMLSVSAMFQSCNKTTCLPPKLVKVTTDVNIVATVGAGARQGNKEIAGDPKAGSTAIAKSQTSAEVRGPLAVGDQVPEFSFMDFSGRTHKLSEFHGHYVLIDFWATWCKPCLADIPHLKELYAKYRDKGFEIIGMDSETLGQDEADADPQFAKDREERARQIVSTRGAIWIHATADTAVPVAVKIFSVKALPTNILIDSQGKIVAWVEEGKELDQVLAKYLDVKQ